MTGLISWIVFGLIAGVIAKFLMPGKDPGGCIITTVLGIVGAVIGGYIGTALGYGTVSGFNLPSFAMAVVGAILLLVLYRAIAGKRR